MRPADAEAVFSGLTPTATAPSPSRSSRAAFAGPPRGSTPGLGPRARPPRPWWGPTPGPARRTGERRGRGSGSGCSLGPGELRPGLAGLPGATRGRGQFIPECEGGWRAGGGGGVFLSFRDPAVSPPYLRVCRPLGSCLSLVSIVLIHFNCSQMRPFGTRIRLGCKGTLVVTRSQR